MPLTENNCAECPQPNGKEDAEPLSSSDDSDEEFCDSIDPAHVSVIAAESITMNDIPVESIELVNGTENNSLLNDKNTDEVTESSRFTSTPFHKKPAHVTFDTDRKKSGRKQGNAVSHHNGGILKAKQAGSGYGGGDHKHSSKRQLDSRYSQARQQPSKQLDGKDFVNFSFQCNIFTFLYQFA